MSSCENGSVCPWLIGDAVLLIPGIVPGVIAFVVDFSTGAWRHEAFASSSNTGAELASDKVTANASRGETDESK